MREALPDWRDKSRFRGQGEIKGFPITGTAGEKRFMRNGLRRGQANTYDGYMHGRWEKRAERAARPIMKDGLVYSSPEKWCLQTLQLQHLVASQISDVCFRGFPTPSVACICHVL